MRWDRTFSSFFSPEDLDVGQIYYIVELWGFFNVYLFILRKREQERGRKRGRQRIPNRLCRAEPDIGLELTNHEIMT